MLTRSSDWPASSSARWSAAGSRLDNSGTRAAVETPCSWLGALQLRSLSSYSRAFYALHEVILQEQIEHEKRSYRQQSPSQAD